MIHAIRSVRTEWERVYQYHGGFPALSRCLLGSVRLELGRSPNFSQSASGVECITFSVVPQMTALWSQFIFRAIGTRSLRVIIGDCSGGLQSVPWLHPEAQVLPLFNAPHGEKLDLFMHKVCKAEYVVVSDDDVFWLSEAPFHWAIDRMKREPQIAVVSLFPRITTKKILQGKVIQAMGSYCLIIRRDIWLKEGLSFKVVRPPTPPGEDHRDWYYDTADYANAELIERGYEVLIAPEAVRSYLVQIEGVSNWTLKARKRDGDVSHLLYAPFLQEKVFRAMLFAEGLASLISLLYPQMNYSAALIETEALEHAKSSCVHLLGCKEAARIEGEVERLLLRIRDAYGQHEALYGQVG